MIAATVGSLRCTFWLGVTLVDSRNVVLFLRNGLSPGMSQGHQDFLGRKLITARMMKMGRVVSAIAAAAVFHPG